MSWTTPKREKNVKNSPGLSRPTLQKKSKNTVKVTLNAATYLNVDQYKRIAPDTFLIYGSNLACNALMLIKRQRQFEKCILETCEAQTCSNGRSINL